MSDSKPPPMASASALLAALLSLLGGATAYKDSDYWPPGESNPLANEKMYWKDSINVLQDLSSFKALYVQYHNCVWSKYGSRYGKGSDYEEEDDDYENGCVGNGYGGENYWYLGRTQCFRANAAFALYGVLNDDEDGEVETDSDGTYCHKGTYINSFFSTYGAESFAGPLGLDTDSVNSYCTTNEPDNEDYMYDYDNADDDFTPYNYKAWTSYGIGCLDGKFVQDKYQGAFCHGSNYIATMDTLDSYNSALESAASCVQIYSYGQEEGSQDEDDDDDEDDGDIDFTEKSTLAVLKYSKACSVRQYPEACPDPHGLKEHYAQVWNRYLYKTGAGAPGRSAAEDAERIAWGVGAAALVVGAALLLCARRTRRRTALKPRGTTITPVTPVKKKTSFGFPKRKRRSNRGGGTPGGSTPPLTPPNSAGDDVDGGGEGDEYKTALKGDPAEAQAQAQAQGAPSPTIRVHSEPLKKTHSLGYRISSSVRNAKLAFQKYAEEEVEVDADVVDDNANNFSKNTQRGYVADAYTKTGDNGDVPRNLEMVDRSRSGATADTAPSALTNTDRSAAGSSFAAARSSSSARAAAAAEKPSDAAAGIAGGNVPFDEREKASTAAAATAIKPDDVVVDDNIDAADTALSSVRASAARAREAAAAAAALTPNVSEVVTPATTYTAAASPTSSVDASAAAASAGTERDAPRDGSGFGSAAAVGGVSPPAPEPDAPLASASPAKDTEAEAAAAAKEGKDQGNGDREEDLPAIIKSAPSHDTNAEDVAVEMEDVPMVAPSAPSSAPASPAAAAAKDQTSPTAAAAARDQTSPAAAAVAAAREEAEAKATADAVLAEMGAVSSPSPVATPHPAAAAVAYPDSTFSSGGKSSSDGNIGKKKRKKKRPLLNKLSKSLFGPSKRTQQV